MISQATYTFTDLHYRSAYDVTHVEGAVLDWGGLNDLYNQGMTTPIVVVNGTGKDISSRLEETDNQSYW